MKIQFQMELDSLDFRCTILTSVHCTLAQTKAWYRLVIDHK